MSENNGEARKCGQSREGVLLVANFASDVGFAWWLMENFWVELSRFFERRGGRAVLVYPKVNEIPLAIRNSNITVLAHDFSNSSLASLLALKKIIHGNDLAHVYLTDRGGQHLSYAFLRAWGIKTIVNHDHSFRPIAPHSVVRRLRGRLRQSLPLLGCDHYIAVSNFIRERLVDDAGVPPQRVSCVLNGIEPIEADLRIGSYVNDAFGFPRDSIIVVSTGRAASSKGLDSLIECARRLLETGSDNLYFLHCGDGPDLERFRGKVTANGMERRFIFAGRRNDIRKILPSCHFGVQISRGEAFSLALLEYLSAGLATLASDVGGNREAIVDGETGYLFPPDNLDKVVDLIQMLSRDEARRAAVGIAARESVREKFDIRRTNRDFLSVYEGILARNR